MKSAIIINLDYERHSAEICRRVLDEIVRGMETAGFTRHFRLFIADMAREEACAEAKRVVAEAEDFLAGEGIFVFDVVRECYWFEYQESNDLLAPGNEMPEVTFLDSGELTCLLGTGSSQNSQ